MFVPIVMAAGQAIPIISGANSLITTVSAGLTGLVGGATTVKATVHGIGIMGNPHDRPAQEGHKSQLVSTLIWGGAITAIGATITAVSSYF